MIDETIIAVGQAHKNYDIVKRLKKLDKKFRDTDWKFLSNTQPVEYSYALRFHSMIQEILGEEK